MKISTASTSPTNSITAHYFGDLVQDFIDPRPDLDTQDLDPGRDLLIMGIEWPQSLDSIMSWLRQGGRCLVDCLWEIDTDDLSVFQGYEEQILVLDCIGLHQPHRLRSISVPNWFWYNESLWYASRSYDRYVPIYNKTHRFFMPIRNRSRPRDWVVSELGSSLDTAIWSYMSQGRELPGIPAEHRQDQRWFDPDWYDRTWFSVVNETNLINHGRPFVTEKTFKPLAFYHPFVVFGPAGTLSHVRSQGFETFGELFDESYDLISEEARRFGMVIEQIQKFDAAAVDHIVRDKLQYNHDRFFNRDLVISRLETELIRPLRAWLGV